MISPLAVNPAGECHGHPCGEMRSGTRWQHRAIDLAVEEPPARVERATSALREQRSEPAELRRQVPSPGVEPGSARPQRAALPLSYERCVTSRQTARACRHPCCSGSSSPLPGNPPASPSSRGAQLRYSGNLITLLPPSRAVSARSGTETASAVPRTCGSGRSHVPGTIRRWLRPPGSPGPYTMV